VKSIIFGVNSQDSIFLSSILKGAGYKVIGVRNTDWESNKQQIAECKIDEFVDVSFSSTNSLMEVFSMTELECVFNLVGFSSVHRSFLDPVSCHDTNFIFVQRLLEAARLAQTNAHIVQCSSAEMYGGTTEEMVSENSVLFPVSPYAVSKAASHLLAKAYRSAYNVKVSSAILFNHESEYRSPNFFTKKVALGLVEVFLGRKRSFQLEKIDFHRDWSYAGDVAKALYLIATSPNPGEYVVSSGQLKSGRELLEVGLNYLGITSDLEHIVEIDKNLARPFDHCGFKGDSSKIRITLGWNPAVGFEEMIKKMIDYELNKFQ